MTFCSSFRHLTVCRLFWNYHVGLLFSLMERLDRVITCFRNIGGQLFFFGGLVPLMALPLFGAAWIGAPWVSVCDAWRSLLFASSPRHDERSKRNEKKKKKKYNKKYETADDKSSDSLPACYRWAAVLLSCVFWFNSERAAASSRHTSSSAHKR